MSKEQIIDVKVSETPDVRIRVIENSDPISVINQKKKYPFELYNSIKVTIITSHRNFTFRIPNGYIWNGADIPRAFWRIIGSRTDNDFLIASLLHDFLLEFKVFIMKEILENKIMPFQYRRLTSLIFRYVVKNQGTNTVKANVMSWCVDVFQSVFCRKKWSST